MFGGVGEKSHKGKLYLSLFVQWHVKSVTLCENMLNQRPGSC